MLKEAYRPVKVRDGEREVRMPAIAGDLPQSIGKRP
jgi:hypothetical protein